MKKTTVIIFLVLLAFEAGASDSPAEISQAISVYPLVPVVSNAYLIIPGAGYEFRLIKDAFLFSAGLSGHAAFGSAITYGEDIFGIYKNEWRVPAAEVTGRKAVYLRCEASASFGWNFFSFFQKRQFIILSFSAIFEREDISGRIFSKLGRYSSCIAVSSEVFELFGNQCIAIIGYSTVSYSDPGKPGTLAGFIKAGLQMDFRQEAKQEIIYKRPYNKESSEKDRDGDTVW